MSFLLTARRFRCAAIVLTALLSAPSLTAGQEPAPQNGRPVATAVRTSSRPPRIDGVLDDAVWRAAPVSDDFRQREPLEGEPVSERTYFQVAYDEEALYVAVRCDDSDPAGIVSRLTRRDAWAEADRVSVNLDPQHDRRSGRWFTVYASGSVGDGAYFADRGEDGAWDGVWEAETSVDATGWSAEFRIPYHVLRFSPRQEYVWGLNVERRISRKQEVAYWPLVRKDQPGWVSQFGTLRGIRDITPPVHLEVVPYGMGHTRVDGGTEYSGRAGLDVRYGLASGVSLNATLNPDFGQVEADPAQLNLTAFEDYYAERRPFFVEGAGVFQNNDYTLFYSRRIGRSPGYYDIPDDAEEIDRADATTIIGAVKMTGKTAGGMSFGLLDAVTAEEEARIERQVDGRAARRPMLVEPRTHYLVGRVEQRVLNETSTVGALGTTVNRQDGPSAWTGAVDWDLKFSDDVYNLTGTLAGSANRVDGEDQSGYLAHLEFDKRTGWLVCEAAVAALSPGVDLNDVGYLRRGDLVRAWVFADMLRYDPWWHFRTFDVGTTHEQQWNYDGTRLMNGLNVSFWGELHSYWNVHLHVGHDFASFDDDDVRRDGPVIRRPAGSWVHGQLETDVRRMVRFTVRPEYERYADGAAWTRGLNLSMELQPLPSMWFSIAPSYSHHMDDAQWIDVVQADDGPHYVYGRLDRRTLDLSTRARLSFTPQLSLELFLQPFIAIGDYRQVKELAEPETYRFRSYPWPENEDFHERSLRSNLVLRWEFSPGSALFVVWSQSRSASLEDPTGEELHFRPLDRLGSAFTDDGDNVFLTKVSYWFGG